MKQRLLLFLMMIVSSLMIEAQVSTIYVKSQIAQETFGDSIYDTDKVDTSIVGFRNHYDWTDVVTFTSTNGYITTGSDSSIRINQYGGGAIQGWDDASGGSGVMMSPSACYSGSWDTLYYNRIAITDAIDLQVEMGLWKRDISWKPPVSTNFRGINVEVSIDGGAWVQLDTSLIQNPLAYGVWTYAELPLPSILVGDTMDIRIANLANHWLMDDLTVTGSVPIPVMYFPGQIARETFGDAVYDTDNPDTSIVGFKNHYNWYDVTTFTSTNGYITTGSDSSIRINQYGGGAIQGWDDASGGSGCMMSPSVSYSGSWDTLYYNSIAITDAKNLQVEMGLWKRDISWKPPVSTDYRGINVEVSVDGGAWVQLDTSLIQNPLAYGTWIYAELPLSGALVGETMDIRIANLANHWLIDDLTVTGDLPVPVIYIEDMIARETFGDAVYDTDNPDTSIVGFKNHYNWYDVTTFTSTNGYITTGSDSSIRINQYGGGATQGWDDASGGSGCMMSPSVSYSGSWDTLYYNRIAIAEAKDLQVEMGLWKRDISWKPPVSTDYRGINVEVSVDGGVWVQLDTTLIQNPLAYGTWIYAELPLPDTLVGDTLDVRIANLANHWLMDDLTVMGQVPVTSDPTRPTMPDSLTATVDGGDVTLAWKLSTDDDTIVGYIISQDAIAIDTIGGLDSTVTIIGLASGEYIFGVSALDNDGKVSEEATVEVLVDVDAPSTPGNFKAVAVEGTVTLTWFAAADNYGVAGYIITQDAAVLDTVTASPYVVTDLTDGTYTFGVSAFDNAGNLGAEATKEVTVTITSISKAEVISLNVYPNPVVNDLYIECDQSIDMVKITDITGVTVLHSSNVKDKINTTSMNPGVYIIQVYTKTNTYQSTFIKK